MAKTLEEYSSEELRVYVLELRKENQRRRQEMGTYTEAFQGLKPDEQLGVLNIVKVFSGDREAGSMLFRQLGDQFLPDQPTKEDLMSDQSNPLVPAVGAPAPAAGDDSELRAVIAALQQEVASLKDDAVATTERDKEREITEVRAYATELGYKPDTPEWTNFFQIAGSDIVGGDMDMAHRLYDTFFPPAAAAGDGTNGAVAGAPATGAPADPVAAVAAQQAAGDATVFPATGKAGSAGAPKLGTTEGEPLDLSLDAVKQRVRASLEAQWAAADNT